MMRHYIWIEVHLIYSGAVGLACGVFSEWVVFCCNWSWSILRSVYMHLRRMGLCGVVAERQKSLGIIHIIFRTVSHLLVGSYGWPQKSFTGVLQNFHCVFELLWMMVEVIFLFDFFSGNVSDRVAFPNMCSNAMDSEDENDSWIEIWLLYSFL